MSVKDVSVQFSGVYPYMAFGCGNSQLGSIITVTAQSSLAEVSCYRGGAYSGCPPATFSADLPNHVPGVIYDWYFATPNIPGKLPNSGDPVLQGQQVTWNSFSFGTEPWLIFVQACPPPSGQTNALDYDCLGTADHYAEASAVVYPPSPPPGPLSFFQGLWNWLGSIWGGIKNIPSKLGDAIGGTYGCFTPSDNPYFPQLPCNLPQWLRNIPFLTLVGGAVGGGIFYWRSKTKGQ